MACYWVLSFSYMYVHSGWLNDISRADRGRRCLSEGLRCEREAEPRAGIAAGCQRVHKGK